MEKPYIEPSIDQVARKVRNAFIEEKTQALKRPYKVSPRHDQMDYFRAAAQNVIKLCADPGDYVKAAMIHCRVKGGPFANSLGGEVAANWYRRYANNAGVAVGPQPKQAPLKEGEAPVFVVQFVCDAEIQFDIETAASTMILNTGITDLKDPKNMAILNNPFYELSTSARCFLGNDETFTTFGKEIYTFFKSQPNYLEAMRRRDFPIDAILIWIDRRVLLIT